MNSILKLGLNLFVICAVSAGLLAGTNEITSPLIAKRSEQASMKLDRLYYQMLKNLNY